MKRRNWYCCTLIAALFILLCMPGCHAEQDQAAMEQSVHEALNGAWVYYDTAQRARYTYLISDGSIEQSLMVDAEDGNTYDLSLGNTMQIHYRVISETEIELYSTVNGTETAGERISFSRPDENTLQLDGISYTRYETWVQGEQDTAD